MSQLRKWRQLRGLSQRELGHAVGVTDNAISQFERGVVKPRLQVCQSLAQALNVDVMILFQDFYGFSLPNATSEAVAHDAT